MTLKNYEEFCARIYNREIPIKDEKIAQTFRNSLRQEIMNAICADFQGTRTIDGIILEIPNEIEGVIFVELNVKFKGFDYDIEEAQAIYKEKLEKRREIAEKKQKKTVTKAVETSSAPLVEE